MTVRTNYGIYEDYAPNVNRFRILENIADKLSLCDFITEQENEQAQRALEGLYSALLPHEVSADFFQIYGIVSSPKNYLLCLNAQIIYLNSKIPDKKESLQRIEDMNLSLDLNSIVKDGSSTLLSIRWYITCYLNLIEWPTESHLEHLNKLIEIGNDYASRCQNKWILIQYYFAILPFSKQSDLRAKIRALKEGLNDTQKAIVQEFLFKLEIQDLIDEPDAPIHSLPFSERVEKGSQLIQEKKERWKLVLEKMEDTEFACQLIRQDLSLQIRATLIRIHCISRKLGIHDLKQNIELKCETLISIINSAQRPSRIHVDAMKIILIAYSQLGLYDKINPLKDKLFRLIDRIKKI